MGAMVGEQALGLKKKNCNATYRLRLTFMDSHLLLFHISLLYLSCSIYVCLPDRFVSDTDIIAASWSSRVV